MALIKSLSIAHCHCQMAGNMASCMICLNINGRNNTMSKVKKEVLEAAVVKLLAKITQTMPTTTYKFLLGSATALMSVSS